MTDPMTQPSSECTSTFRPRHSELTTPEARISAFARWFDVPGIPVTQDRNGCLLLTDALLDWCGEHGVSIDWVVSGNPAGMASTFRDKHCLALQKRDPHPEWHRQWRELTAAWNTALHGQQEETPESESIWAERDQIENNLTATPVHTIAGACAVLQWVLEESKGAFTYAGHESALAHTLKALEAMV